MQNYCPGKTVQHHLSIILFLSTENVSRTNLLTLTHVSKKGSSVKNIFSYSMVCQRNIAAVDGPEGHQRSVNENKTKSASRVATEPSKIGVLSPFVKARENWKGFSVSFFLSNLASASFSIDVLLSSASFFLWKVCFTRYLYSCLRLRGLEIIARRYTLKRRSRIHLQRNVYNAP